MELDKLIVKIEADLKGLKDGLRNANKHVGKNSNNMKNSFKSLGNTIDNLGKRVLLTYR